MKILVLGGTKFLGYHIVNEAIKRNHEVTIFNRGISSDKAIPKEVNVLKGDRDGDLSALKDKSWDIIIDTSGYLPRVVKKSAELLVKSTELYVFVSTISVYQDFSKLKLDESADVAKLKDYNIEEVTGEAYGPLKAQCEKEVKTIFPANSLIIRPGLIVGPDDYTDRFTYWPSRISLGGEVLVPSEPSSRKIQFIDVRDLALFILKLSEEKKTGTYNVTGPREELTFEQFIHICKKTTKSDARFTFIDEDFLENNNVTPWIEMPLYVQKKANMAGMLDVSIEKALSEGLSIRPLEDTINDTLQWDSQRGISESERKAGLTREKEKVILENWKTHMRH